MTKDMITINSTIPVINKVYSSFDILGNIFGRYFDYKRETAMINHETIKVERQAQIIMEKIDAELNISLDMNKKSFQKEMFRLKSIAKELANNYRSQKEILNHIKELTRMLKKSDIELSVKEQIPQLIALAHQQLNDMRDSNKQNINTMSNFNSNQKKIK